MNIKVLNMKSVQSILVLHVRCFLFASNKTVNGITKRHVIHGESFFWWYRKKNEIHNFENSNLEEAIVFEMKNVIIFK